jgi:hypothetical protein
VKKETIETIQLESDSREAAAQLCLNSNDMSVTLSMKQQTPMVRFGKSKGSSSQLPNALSFFRNITFMGGFRRIV